MDVVTGESQILFRATEANVQEAILVGNNKIAYRTNRIGIQQPSQLFLVDLNGESKVALASVKGGLALIGFIQE